MNSVVDDLLKYDDIEATIDEYKMKKQKDQSLEINVTALDDKRYVEISLKNLSDTNREAKSFTFNANFDTDILPRLAFKYCNCFDTKKHYILPDGDNGYYANVSTSGDCFRLNNIDLKCIEEMEDIIKLDEEDTKKPDQVGENKALKVVEAIMVGLITLIIGLLVLYILFYLSK